MKKRHLLFACVAGWLCMKTTDISAQESSRQMKELIIESGVVHRPLPLNTSRSLEEAGLRKKILISTPLCSMKSLDGWYCHGIGKLERSTEKSISGDGSLKLTVPTECAEWKNSDHGVYGYSQAAFDVKGANWEKYNRIFFYIYPDCEGSRNVHLNLYIHNDGKLKIPDEYGREGAHEINLINHQWNKCYLEITELPRDKVTRLSFGATAFGRDRTTGKTMEFYIDSIALQQVARPEIGCGWSPQEERIVYSTSGYTASGKKTAITALSKDTSGEKFRLLDGLDNHPVYEGTIRKELTAIGSFGILDFSDFHQTGNYRLQTDHFTTPPFRIDENIWENSVWKVLNFIFCERCGYPVPGKHDYCHADIHANHNGRTIAYNGGWHDAGDMSQQTLQTGDVMFALLELANKVKGRNPLLYQRLMEEAKWGLDFILKCRFGDGYRASSAGMAIWTDNMTGNEDDTPARVHNNPFDNFLLAGMEAYASLSIDDDPALKGSLIRTAKEDFDFALKEHLKTGYGHFKIFWEHSYNTSESQYMATASWAASQLFQLTGDNQYALHAAEFAEYVLACQRTEPLKDKDHLCGFFYRDSNRKVITHFNHQSRDQVYMQSLIALCETQPSHPSYGKWKKAIERYASYLKGITRYSQPYGMIPSGVYHIDEAKDSLSFYAQHLFPGEQAINDYTQQLKNGTRLDKEHYLRIFPVWFSFRGNTAIHLATGKAAALCGNFLNDQELKEIAEDQLRWTVGRNPFGQSLMYGEGDRYAQQYAALPGEMTGELPVGIQTKYNEDKPYWPQCNNATYKEVWMTSAGKWLSLIAELKTNPVVIAYVTSWSHILPDPNVVTHINYAFGHVTESFNGVGIANEKRLREVVALKKQHPSLKILLSIGGWGSGRFSEMAATAENRKAFAIDCKRVIDEYNLDGIDIDWEYPTSKAAGISASVDDTRNYTLMMQEIRKAIGKEKLLTLASVASAQYIDFTAIEPYVDFVNIMTYDIATPPYHHASLFHSDMTRGVSCEEAVEAHVKAGMPIHRLVLGIPFYGHGKDEIANFIDYKNIIGLIGNGTYSRKWDAQAKVPYLINTDGKMVCTYEDVESIKEKCRFIHEKGMLGGMYWDYDGDDAQGTLRKTVYEKIMIRAY